jgi:adenylate kinase
MMCGITGTPGTGKSAVAAVLGSRGEVVIILAETMGPYIIGTDEDRDTRVVDEERWAAEFPHREGFVEGHLAHLLPCERIVVLRCRPDILAGRLASRGYPPEKIWENVEAEALDLILCETLELHPESEILEIDTTGRTPEETAGCVLRFVRGDVPATHGSIDWSGYLVVK